MASEKAGRRERTIGLVEFVTAFFDVPLYPWQVETLKRIEAMNQQREREKRIPPKTEAERMWYVLDEVADINEAFLWSLAGGLKPRYQECRHNRHVHVSPKATTCMDCGALAVTHPDGRFTFETLEERTKREAGGKKPYQRPALASKPGGRGHWRMTCRRCGHEHSVNLHVCPFCMARERREGAKFPPLREVRRGLDPSSWPIGGPAKFADGIKAGLEVYCPTCKVLIAPEQVGERSVRVHDEGSFSPVRFELMHYPHGPSIAGVPTHLLHRVTKDPSEFPWNKDAERGGGPVGGGPASSSSDSLEHRLGLVRAELRKWQTAFGIASTIDPSMVIDIGDPEGMAHHLVAFVESINRELGAARGAAVSDAPQVVHEVK